MKLVELLKRIQSENTPVIVNGITGRITEIGEELVSLEIIRKKELGKEKGKVMFKETIHIPLDNIWSVSQGEKEIPKSKEEKAIEEKLAKALEKPKDLTDMLEKAVGAVEEKKVPETSSTTPTTPDPDPTTL